MRRFGNEWPTDRIEQLKKLRAANLSASEIAAEIGGGISRSAVLGKLHRLGLSRPSFIVRRAAKKTDEPRPIRKVTRVVRANGNSDKMRFLECPETDLHALRCAEVVPLNLPLTDLAHDGCRYPYGEGPFTFCGQPQVDGSSYCGAHWALTWSRPRGSNQAAAESRRRNLHKQRKSSIVESFA